MKTSFEATSLLKAKGSILTFVTPAPYKVMTLASSDDWLEHSASIFEVNPKAALESIQEHLCKPKLSPDWAYVWGLFVQTKLLLARTEPEVVKAMQDS